MQKTIQGIEKIEGLLKTIGCRNIFMVIDSSYQFLNIKDRIERIALKKTRFSDFTPNPLYEDVCKGIDLFHKEKCDAILAVGGGSSIDVAKCIKLAVLAKEGRDSLIPPLVSKHLDIDGGTLPFIAIPTTAGTGSESTHNAVMYYQGAKQTVTNDGVLPDFAILEPSVLKTLPLYQKKCTMMDALCQGIESWWSVNSTDESRNYSKIAVEMIVKYWRSYIFDNDDYAAYQIMKAANYSGKAINISATTAAHAMSYKITSLYHLPHGHAVAVCLPEIWNYMLGISPKLPVFFDISKAMGFDNPFNAVTAIRNMMIQLNLKNPVAENRKKELDVLSKSVNPVRLKNNPIAIDEDVAWKLYDKIVL